MEKNLDYYLSLPYRMEVIPDTKEGGYAFRCPELPGCITCAETVEDGLHMVEDAKREWLSACLEDGTTIPEPDAMDGWQFELRLPRSLHQRLAEQSRAEGVSMNQYCVYLLSKVLG